MSFFYSAGIQTSQDARFYALSNKFKPFSNKDKDLVVQFTVKHEQNIDCGGGYVKVFDCSLDQKDMHGETPYLLMFGRTILFVSFAFSPSNKNENFFMMMKKDHKKEFNSSLESLATKKIDSIVL